MAAMTADTAPSLTAGHNLAMKIPSHQFDATVRFYRDIIRLPHLGRHGDSEVFELGAMRLFLDPVPHLSQAEIWLDLETPDTDAAARYLEDSGIPRCDGVEELPHGFDGFWVVNPAGIVHLIDGTQTR